MPVDNPMLDTIPIHLLQLEICMELASGVGFDGRQISEFVVNQSRGELAIPLNELYKRGLPTCTRPVTCATQEPCDIKEES